jgi:hypothetical protein
MKPRLLERYVLRVTVDDRRESSCRGIKIGIEEFEGT